MADLDEASFGSIIAAFSKVCNDLEVQASNKLTVIENESANEVIEAKKTLSQSDRLISRINNACMELTQSDELVKILLEKIPRKESILLPYCMHADTVKSIQNVFTEPFSPPKQGERKIVNEHSNKIVADVLRSSLCNVSELQNIETTIVDIQENAKII